MKYSIGGEGPVTISKHDPTQCRAVYHLSTNVHSKLGHTDRQGCALPHSANRTGDSLLLSPLTAKPANAFNWCWQNNLRGGFAADTVGWKRQVPFVFGVLKVSQPRNWFG